MGKFEKGVSGNPLGKPKGVVSHKRLVLENFVNIIVEEGTERFNQELNSLEGKDFVQSYLTLLEYARPKLARTTLEGDANNPIQAKIVFEEIRTYAPIGKTDSSD
jgi:hypothetical protein